MNDERAEYRRILHSRGTDLQRLYEDEVPAKRLRGIYRTSRFQISEHDAAAFWQDLSPLRDVCGSRIGRDDYDKCLIGCALSIQATLQDRGIRGGFGVGQKVANLYMKDQWALGRVDELEDVLHAPVDRIVLRALGKSRSCWPRSWRAWTKVTADGEDCNQVRDYRSIQQAIRDWALEVGDCSAIRREQNIWQTGARQ